MSEDRSRTGRAAFEVPLSSDDPIDATAPDGGTPPTNWRKIVGLSAAAGVILGIVGALVISVLDNGGDPIRDEDAPPPATLEDASVLITTPPTLPPPPTSSLPTTGPQPATTVRREPATETTVGDLTVITIPQFVPVEGANVGSIELGPAVAALGDDVARLSTTMFQSTDPDELITVQITRDPVNDRDRLTLTDERQSFTLIIDHGSDLVYVAEVTTIDEPDRWVRRTTAEILEGSGLRSLRELVEPQLLGPVRPDTVDAATVSATDVLISIGDSGPMARRFIVTVPSDRIVEWVTYIFGVDWGVPIDGPGIPNPAPFEVFVSDAGRVELVTSRFLIDGAPRGFSHRIETLAERVAIDLPDPQAVTDG